VPHYKIVKPCAYVLDGDTAVFHKTAGAVVELTPHQARHLRGRVELITGNNHKPAPEAAEPEKEGNTP
jgi:hypothetical protein